LILSLVYLNGCVTIPPPPPTASLIPKKGVYHKVNPGETLWRIAKTYGVTINQLIKSNNIPNGAYIEKGQLLFIPGAESIRAIILNHDPKDNEFVWPVKGKVILYFGDRKGAVVNKGIHIQANEGDTVCASRAGKVVFADYLDGYGYTIILSHEDGFYSVYSQNSKLLVGLNDYIPRGNPIAQVGQSGGQLAFLHFEIRKNAKADNPLYYLP